jgi:hypothetical protein
MRYYMALMFERIPSRGNKILLTASDTIQCFSKLNTAKSKIHLPKGIEE